MSVHESAAPPSALPASPPSTTTTNVVSGALVALFLANLVNFFDRSIPSVVAEPIKAEFSLSDLQLGLVMSAFTLVYAIAGLPLGRLADTGNRPKIIGVGLLMWSGLTAATGAAGSYLLFILARLGVGIGEASFTPAANSMIGDMYPAERRSRALGIFMLGLPLGLMLAFFTVGKITEAFGSWRAPFFVAAVPGVALAVVLYRMRDPERGAAEHTSATGAAPTGAAPVSRPIRRLLSIPTLRWLILAGLTFNFAAYAVNSFVVPLLMRQYELKLTPAAAVTGIIVGLTGLVGLVAGARLADRASTRSPNARLRIGVFSCAAAAPLTALALMQNGGSVVAFTAFFAAGWLLAYAFYISVYPTIHDVVVPPLRATATALFFAAMYLLGGFSGPVVVGAISDWFAERALDSAGTGTLAQYAGEGLNSAMYLVPIMLALTAVFIFLATRTVAADATRMRRTLEGR